MKMNTTIAISSEGWYLMVSPVFVILLHVIHFFVGLPLNIYVITLLLPGHEGIEVAGVFTLNQALAEITIMFLGPFHYLCTIGPKLCFLKPLGFMLGITSSSRAVFQCCECLERYIAVVHPLIFLRFRPVRYRIEFCIFGWIVALAFAIVCMLTVPNMPYHIYSSFYIIILALNVFFCLSILKKLRHPGPGNRDRRNGEKNAVKKKAFQVVSMNLLAFTIQVVPLAVTFGLRNNLSLSDFSLATVISLTISITGGFVQPIFVLHKAGKLSLVRNIWVAKNRSPYPTCC